METNVRLYEALFLVDTAEATTDWDGIAGVITKIIEKHGGKIDSLKKWDERRLAYEIQGKTRGTYILVYCNCPTDALTHIERDCQLSERIMRVMILATEKMGKTDLEKPTPIEAVAAAEAKEAEEKAAAAAEKQEETAEKTAEESAE